MGEKLTGWGRLSPRGLEAKLLVVLKPEPCRLPAIPAASVKDLELRCLLQPFGQNRSSTRMGSAGQLGSKYHPCDEKESLRGVLKIQILGLRPSGGWARGSGIYTRSAPSGAAILAPD